MACPSEIPALRSARSVRSYEVWLAVGPRHGELGGADIDGAHHSGTRKETGTEGGPCEPPYEPPRGFLNPKHWGPAGASGASWGRGGSDREEQ